MAALRCDMDVPELGQHQYKQLTVEYELLFLNSQYIT